VAMVIRDAPSLQRIWAQAVSKQTAPPAAPTADFAREMFRVVGGGGAAPAPPVGGGRGGGGPPGPGGGGGPPPRTGGGERR
jgi:hypothetical protein